MLRDAVLARLHMITHGVHVHACMICHFLFVYIAYGTKQVHSTNTISINACRKVNDRDKPSIVRRSTRLQDKAKVTTEQTNMKSWATGESGHRQTGKKNAQPSTFGKVSGYA